MAFGFPITNGTVDAEGTYGYIIGFNLTAYEPRAVSQIQLQETDPANVMSDPVTAISTLAALYAFPEDSICPDIAFAQQGNIVYIFLKTAVYTFVATVRIAFWYYRNAQNLATTANKLDIPQEAKELFKQLVLKKQALLTKGGSIPATVTAEITEQKTKLGLTA